MRHGNLQKLRGRLEALEQTSQASDSGVWVSAEEVNMIRAKLRHKLGLPPSAGTGRGARAGFFYTSDTAESVRRKLQARIAEVARSSQPH